MEIGEQVAIPVPKPPPKAPPKSKFEGVIQGPAGPLEGWPFLLKKNGQPVDQGGLGGGSSPNAYRDGAWISGSSGEFEFEEMPEGRYAVEVLLHAGKLDPKEPHASVNESGLRASTPAPLDGPMTERPPQPTG